MKRTLLLLALALPAAAAPLSQQARRAAIGMAREAVRAQRDAVKIVLRKDEVIVSAIGAAHGEQAVFGSYVEAGGVFTYRCLLRPTPRADAWLFLGLTAAPGEHAPLGKRQRQSDPGPLGRFPPADRAGKPPAK